MSKMNRAVRVMVISYVAVAAWMSASAGFVSDAQRVDVVSYPQGKVQMDSIKTPSQKMRVDVIESSGSGGAWYPYTNAQRVDVIENLNEAVTHPDSLKVKDRVEG